MNTSLKLLTLLTVLMAASFHLGSAEKKRLEGPKGGRLLDSTPPLAEFLVANDRTVTLAFYDAQLKPVAVTGQSAKVLAETKSGKTTLDFTKQGDLLATQAKLPEGEDYNVVVQLKHTPEAKPRNYRFTLDLSPCGGCKRPEYACACHE